MDSLTSVVNRCDDYISTSGNVNEWRHPIILRDSVIPELNNAFRAKFDQIEGCHDLGASEENTKDIIHYTRLDTLITVLRDWGKDQKAFFRMYDSFHLNDPEEGAIAYP